MRLQIRHAIVQTYDAPFLALSLALRLTPRPHGGQIVQRWSVSAVDGPPLAMHEDGYGNIVHTHAVRGEGVEAAIAVEGEVETTETYGILKGTIETITPRFFLSATGQTQSDERIAAVARAVAEKPGEMLPRLHRLMLTLRDLVAHDPAGDQIHESAPAAMLAGHGTAADLAHVFIAAARTLEVPARYVSGYHWTGDEVVAPALHGWAEAFVEGLGWVGFDVANGLCPTEAYVRLACGRSHAEAAPVRSARTGGDSERISMSVRIAAGQQAQQQ